MRVEENPNHPCYGKDCLNCETCIFDVELFPDKVTPNQKKNETKTNNMCNRRLCNNCVNLSRIYDNCEMGKFDATCKVVSYEAFGQVRPRKIDFNISAAQDIVAPVWCPLKQNDSQLALPSQVTHRPNPQQTGPSGGTSTTPIYTSYSDRREAMKGLKKHIEWEDIQEGKVYIIPKILSQSRKIVKVITKTPMSCICHEISEYTGNEYSYNTTFYASDLDAVFITEMREF